MQIRYDVVCPPINNFLKYALVTIYERAISIFKKLNYVFIVIIMEVLESHIIFNQ